MKLAGLTGLLTAFVSSLCCTVPLLTLLVGATGSAGGWRGWNLYGLTVWRSRWARWVGPGMNN
ncbi:hypothetical protein A6C57_27980 (plasmid) [Fibrella sp. ES10-3-2-2]